MSTQYLEPARSVIEKICGQDDLPITKQCAVVGAIVGLDFSSVYRWMLPKESGGRDGRVPDRYHQGLLDYAEDNKIKLGPADFFVVAKPKRSNGRVPLVA